MLKGHRRPNRERHIEGILRRLPSRRERQDVRPNFPFVLTKVTPGADGLGILPRLVSYDPLLLFGAEGTPPAKSRKAYRRYSPPVAKPARTAGCSAELPFRFNQSYPRRGRPGGSFRDSSRTTLFSSLVLKGHRRPNRERHIEGILRRLPSRRERQDVRPNFPFVLTKVTPGADGLGDPSETRLVRPSSPLWC